MANGNGSQKRGNAGRRSLQMAADLRAAILEGKYNAGQFLPSVRELNRSLGLATETVRRSLKTLEAEGLITAVPRQGYRVVGGVGGADKGMPLAYLAYQPHGEEDVWDDFHKTLLGQFQETASSRGWSLLTVKFHEGEHVEVYDQVRLARVIGVVTDRQDLKLVALLSSVNVPLVVVDGLHEQRLADAVVQDGFQGAILAASHLIEKGHKDIAWIAPDPAPKELQILERHSGAWAALSRAGLSLDSMLKVRAPLEDAEAALAGARQFFAGGKCPSAILALWQKATEVVVQAAREAGKVPGVDFDMVSWCSEEEYDAWYRPLFGDGPVPPAVTWSIADMTEMAVACIRQRRSHPEIPPMLMRVAAKLRVAE